MIKEIFARYPKLAPGIVTVGGIGRMQPAPGTWASLAALVAGLVLVRLIGFLLFIVLLVALAWIALRACEEVLQGQEDQDPSWIVIDEVIGQWVAMLPALAMPWLAFVSFGVFRALDILKPWPINMVEEKWQSPLGAMLDDVVAGVIAGFAVAVLGQAFL
ncbi:MAG: phosphatidylglycerophosphatase A [Dongiaceae bacterium]